MPSWMFDRSVHVGPRRNPRRACRDPLRIVPIVARALALAILTTAAVGCGASPSAARTVVRVNQVGLPGAQPKTALLMSDHNLGRPSFAVLDGTGHAVFRGRASRSRGGWSRRWPYVYALDFGRVGRPGSYRVVVGRTRSQPFPVGPARPMYVRLAGNAVTFLQAQRDGRDVVPGALRRAPSHLLDGQATVYATPTYRGLRLVRALRPTGGPVDVSGGWFDAGDYLKFVETHSFDEVAMLFALREYGAGIPDPAAARAEARFGLDWLLKMWDQSRRVLYYQAGIGDGNGGSVLGDHDLWRLPQADDSRRVSRRSPAFYVSHRPVFAANAPGAPISPNLAGRTAAAFALCAQVFADIDPAYAHRCLLAGQSLFDQANTHPRTLTTSSPYGYYTESEWRDDLELGATELYLATHRLPSADLPHPDPNHYYLDGAARWADAYMSSRMNGVDSFNVYDVAALAHYDLHRILSTSEVQHLEQTDGTIDVTTSPGALRADLAGQLRLAARTASRDPFRLASVSGNADTVTHSLGNAVTARLYDALAGGHAFEPLARNQLDWVLGTNPWGTSFIVGAGRVFPRCPAHQVANLSGSLTGRGRLLVGATVIGPTSGGSARDRGAPDGYRRCARGGFGSFGGHAMTYADDVTSPATSEPATDGAALSLLAFAQQAVR
jgi:endoglucanase